MATLLWPLRAGVAALTPPLRSGTSRAGPSPCGGGRVYSRLPRSGRRESAVCRWLVRRSSLDGRRHVHSRSAACRRGTRACLQTGRSNRTRKLDSGRICRKDFKTIGRYLPLPVGATSPALWGTEERIHELFPHAKQVKVTRRIFNFRALTAVHWLDEFQALILAPTALETEGNPSQLL